MIHNYQYVAPVTPSSWTGEEKRYANAVKDVLDEIYSWRGRLTDKDISKQGMTQIVTHVVDVAQFDSANIRDLEATVARIASATIGSATINAAQIKDLYAVTLEALNAQLHEAKIDWATITTLTAELAKITKAEIATAVIKAAQIEDLQATVADIIHLEAATGKFDLAEVKNLLADALVLESGTAGSMYITNLSVTSANLLSAMLGKLVLKGTDGKYYQIMVGADGKIHTQPVDVTPEEEQAGQTTGGQGIVDTGENVGSLSGQTVHAQEAVLGRITAKALAVGKLTAGEAMIASATIPTLYASSISAIGNSLDLSANTSITTIVGGSAQALEGMIETARGQLEELEKALDGKADADTVVALSSRLEQNADSITAIISQIGKVEGDQDAADKVLAEYQLTFRIDAQGVTIGKSTSPFDVRIDEQRMSFREDGQEIAYISNQTLHIREAEVEDQLKIGSYSLQRMEDGSLGLMVV